jgi:thiol-disulfide isomerase/thioredoxin
MKSAQCTPLTRCSLFILIFLGVSILGWAQGAPSPPKNRTIPESTPAPKLSSPAPDFTLESLTGNNPSLSDYRGKVVLLNFWATWCGPCKILTPWFVELQNAYGPQGLQIIGVALDEDATKAEIAEFADKMRVNYPILIGNEKVARAYGGIPAMPVSFFIGRDGKMIDQIVGIKGKGEFEVLIQRALEADLATNHGTQPQN